MTAEVTPMPQLTLEELALMLADAQERAENATQRVEAVKAAIRTHPDVHGPDSYAAGNLTIAVQPNQRFDQRLAEQAIPQHLWRLVSTEKTVRTFDRKRIEVLCPEHLEACIATFDDKVGIR